MLKKITIYIAMAALCPNLAQAQHKNSAHQSEIQLGDKVPDIYMENILNHPSTKAKLSDFNNKVIILDFWATWCASCIHAFPHSQALQDKYKNLQFLLINNSGRDDKNKIGAFLTKFKQEHPQFSLPIVIGNEQTRALYLKGSLPHYIWIGYDRKVKAITGAEALTETNIERFIAGAQLNLPAKQNPAPIQTKQSNTHRINPTAASDPMKEKSHAN